MPNIPNSQMQQLIDALNKIVGANGGIANGGLNIVPTNASGQTQLTQAEADSFNDIANKYSGALSKLNNALKNATDPSEVTAAYTDLTSDLNKVISDTRNLSGILSNDTIRQIEKAAQRLIDKQDKLEDAFNDSKLDESIKKLGSSWAVSSRNFGKSIQSFGEGFKGVGTWGKTGKVFSSALQGMGGSIAKAGGVVAGFAGKMSPLIAGVQLADKAFKACAEKLMAYRSLHTDQYIKALGAETVKQTNSIKISVTAMSNAVQASTDAITANIETNVAATKAIAENQLAQMKMNHTWTNWIPIWGTINKMQEQKMELENTTAMAEIDSARKVADMWINNAKTINDSMQKMDEAQRAYQRLVGIPSSQMDEFREGLYKAGEAVAEFGKTTEDIMKARTSFINESGRNIAWSQIDTSKALSTGSIVGDETMNSFAAGMVLFNTSVADSAEIMLNVYKDANKMGISSQKLTKSVLSNLKQANKYNFRDGVEGFIKAAKWAETARYDMNALGATLDKVQEGGLQGVLQQSAQLQVLGGNAALNGDPIKMMYAAYNDPEEFARMQQDALKNFGHINSKTGETQFNMADQMQISAIAKAYGLSKEQAMEMARASNKRSAIESVNGRLKGEDLDAVANRAQFNKETRQWEVTMNDGTSKNVSQLTAADLEKIAPEDTRTSEEIAKDTLSATEKIAVEAAHANIMLAKIGGFDEYIRHVDQTTKETREANDKNVVRMVEEQKNVNIKGEEDLRKELSLLGESSSFAKSQKAIEENTAYMAMDKSQRKEYRNLKTPEEQAKYIKGIIGTADPYNSPEPVFTDKWTNLPRPTESVNDGIIYHSSGKVVSFDDNDDIMAAKSDGFFSKAVDKREKIAELISPAMKVSKVLAGGVMNMMPMGFVKAISGVADAAGISAPYSKANTEISIKPVEIRLNGTLNLNGGGQNVNIIDQLKNNQEFLKQLSQMISSEMSKAINGGKSVAWNGRFGK